MNVHPRFLFSWSLAFATLCSLVGAPETALAYTDKWVSVPGRDVHVFTREGVVWGLIIDNGTLTSGKHEVAPTNFGAGGGVQVVNESAASLSLTFDGSPPKVIPSGADPFNTDSDLILYSVDYGTATPGLNDRITFNELSGPVEVNGVFHNNLIDFQMLIDLGGGTLGQPTFQLSYRRADQLTPTPFVPDGPAYAIDPLTVSGKFMLIEVPEPTGTVTLASLLAAALAPRRRA